MKTIQLTIYAAAELSEAARTKAYDQWLETACDHDWHDFVREDAKEIAGLFGITDYTLYFSGFASQGDGACFVGSYAYAKGAPKAIRAHAPEDPALHGIADGLQALQARHFYGLTAEVTHRDRYYHDRSVDFDIRKNGDCPSDAAAGELKDLLRRFMRWTYRTLEAEYDELRTEGAFLADAAANEYAYTANGKRF